MPSTRSPMKKISERKTGGAMKFSFSTKGWNLPTWADFIEKACEMGYDGIEIHDIHNRTFTGKNAVFDKNMVRATYRNLREKGLSVPCIDSVCDIGSPSDFDSTASEIVDCIETAASLKIPYVRIRAYGSDIEKTENAQKGIRLCYNKIKYGNPFYTGEEGKNDIHCNL